MPNRVDPALHKARAELRHVVLTYGRHKPDCYSKRSFERECDCGFYKLKQAALAPESEEDSE